MNEDYQTDLSELAEDSLDGDTEALDELKALADEGDVEAEMLAELIPDFVDFHEDQPEDGAFD